MDLMNLENQNAIKNYVLHNSLREAKDFYSKHSNNISIPILLENTFIDCCDNGFLDCIIWLFELDKPYIIEYYFNKITILYIFKNCAMDGHYDMMCWFYNIIQQFEIKLDIVDEMDEVFNTACRFDNIMIARFLCNIYSNYVFTIHPRSPYEIIRWCINPKRKSILDHIKSGSFDKAFEMLECSEIEKGKDDFQCLVCMDEDDAESSGKHYKIITKCRHNFCISCIVKWINGGNNNTCPYCRSEISYKSSFKLKNNQN